MPTLSLSLRDKFLISFLGLAIILTGMLTILASRVSELLPELTLSKTERYEAQLVLRDMREAILSSELPAVVHLNEDEDQVLREAFEQYQSDFSLNVSPSAYQALVTEDKSSLLREEVLLLDNIRSNLALYHRYKQENNPKLRDVLQNIVDRTAQLEDINRDALMILTESQQATRRYVITFFLISIAILLLGIAVFAQLLAVWITYPLRKIQQAAVRISEGDFSHELKPDSKDELGMLMESFDDMRRKVLQSLDEVRAFAKRDEMLINSIVDIIIAVDENMNIILFNEAAEGVSGWSDVGAIHKPLQSVLEFGGVDHEGNAEQLIRTVMETSRAQSLFKPIEIRGTKNDHVIQATMSVAPFVEGEGRRGSVIVLRDVSETVELDKLREEFVSITSHQLRTPLTAIRWLLEMLIRGENEKKINLDNKHKNTLHQAYSRTLSMSELVSSLLALSRVDAQKIKAKLSPISITEIFEKLRLSLQSYAERQGVTMSFASQVKRKVLSDEVILMQILVNIAGNAVKYSKSGGDVHVHANAEGDKLVFAIKDSGIGIPEDQQQTIFKKFFRAKNALSHTPEGTGIGLYMVRSFAELLGGNVSFLSEEDKGTTFTISFPLQYSDD